MPGSFATDIENFVAAGCKAMEVWLTKLEKHLEVVPVAATVELLANAGIAISAAAYQGGLLLSQGEQRKAHFDHFRQRLEMCQVFGIRTLILAADFAQKPDSQSLGRAVVSLAQAAEWAAAFGVRIALEFRGTDAFCASLDTATSLVEQTRQPNVGVCLDVFHYYKGPSKFEDLNRLTPANLFHVHLCDVPGVPREMMTDSDRVMPGDGDFHIEPIIHHLRKIGYEGAVSLELMNQELWSANPKQVLEIGLTALERFLTPSR